MAITMTTTNAYTNLLRQAQLTQSANTPGATPTDVAPYYVAVGTGTAVPAAGDTGLGAEVFRKPLTKIAAGVNAGELTLTGYLGPADAVGVAITEVGVFAGATAGATSGSGVLMGRALYSHTHTNSESVTLSIDWTNHQV